MLKTGAIDPNSMLNNANAEPSKLFLNQQNLARAWDVSQRSTANDWHEWLWKFNIDLLRESPMPTMRACAPLAQAHEAMVSRVCLSSVLVMFVAIGCSNTILFVFSFPLLLWLFSERGKRHVLHHFIVYHIPSHCIY